MRKPLITAAIVTIGIGVVVTIVFLSKLANFYTINGEGNILLPETGQVGDFIGGIVGTIFSLSGFFILVLTLNEQTSFANKERFESKFFDLLKLHRENVRELESTDKNGRQVIYQIFNQFLTCREDIITVFRKKKVHHIYEDKYLQELNKSLKITNEYIDLIKLAKINLPYLIVFYGVNATGKEAIYQILKGRYKREFLEAALEFISLKPVVESAYWDKWLDISRLESKRKVKVGLFVKKLRNQSKLGNSENEQIAKKLLYPSKYIKYYGGHQFQLGHYFRHLFQTFTFINSQEKLSFKEKYFYSKTLRAQLSTHEQYLLLINSVSVLGLVWDLVPETKNCPKYLSKVNYINENRLITRYNLVKNIPSSKVYGLNLRQYYPDVEYEFDNEL